MPTVPTFGPRLVQSVEVAELNPEDREQVHDLAGAFDRAADDLDGYLDQLERRVTAVEAEIDVIDRSLDDFDEQPAPRPACALLSPLTRVPRMLGQTASAVIRITAQLGTFVTRTCPVSLLRHEPDA